MISTPASTCSAIDEVRNVSASCGVPNSGRRVRSNVNTTGSAARPISAPATMRSPVPSVCEMSPSNSGHAGEHEEEVQDAGGDGERRVPDHRNGAAHTPP